MDNQYNPNNFNPNNNPNNYGMGQQPGYNSYSPRRPYDPNSEPMTLKDWILSLLLLMIPFANLILPFIWAFGDNVNKSKKTYFQAYLIIWLIRAIISVFIAFLFIGFFAAIFSNLSNELNNLYY